MSKRLAQALVGSLLGLGLALVLVQSQAATGPVPGSEFLLPAPLPAPDFELMKHTGETVRLNDLADRQTLVLFFGYTHCPDICPLTMAAIGRARELLGKDGPQVLGVLITVDPERDTPEQLTTYLTRFPPGLVALTGSREALAAVTKDYLVSAEHEEHVASETVPRDAHRTKLRSPRRGRAHDLRARNQRRGDGGRAGADPSGLTAPACHLPAPLLCSRPWLRAPTHLWICLSAAWALGAWSATSRSLP